MQLVTIICLSLLSAGALAGWLSQLARQRAKYEHRGLLGRWPIRTVAPHDIDPVFKPDALGPTRDTEIAFIAGLNVLGGISDLETWILCTLAKKSRAIFEFGTCTGKTTYLLARNAPRDATVTTLNLAPNQVGDVTFEAGDAGHDRRAALRETDRAQVSRFYYSATDVEGRIRQLFGDSKAFDEKPYSEAFDLIFVDGCHARSYVENDSRKALAMLKPGGLVFWHDYRGPWRAPGVYRALNQLAKELPLCHVAGTSLVFYRKPVEQVAVHGLTRSTQ